MGCGFSKDVNPDSESHFGLGYGRREKPEQARKRVLTKLNADVEKQLHKAHNQTIQRALFLGTGESGKSTVFKQLRLNYANSYDAFERYQYSKLIWIDTIRMLRVLLDTCVKLRRDAWFNFSKGADRYIARCCQLIQSLDLSKQALLHAERDPQTRGYLNAFHVAGPAPARAQVREPIIESARAAIGDDSRVSLLPATDRPSGIAVTRTAVGKAVHDLWAACPEDIRDLVAANELDGMETNASFFLNKVLAVSDPTYLASDEDILRARIKTTGITTAKFNVKGTDLVVMDVGGQRVERRKWIYSFDDVTTVLFVVAVSEFDQVLVEDSRVNRLAESLAVFEQAVNSQWFRAKSVTLFFNKTDILERKVRLSNFSDYFPDYQGNNQSADEVMNYIESMFKRRIKLDNRNLYTHRTCATDSTSMTFVMSAVTDTILYENLRWAGLI